jgi:hypothetical protein
MRFTLISSTHFILQNSFIQVFSQLLFLFSEIAEMRRIPLWCYSCLWKTMGILPKVYKCICGFYLSKTPTSLWSTFQHRSTKKKICYMCICYYLNLKIYLKVSPIHHTSLVSLISSFQNPTSNLGSLFLFISNSLS